MPDYSKTIIYKLCCKDPEIKEIYIGSTCNLKTRKHQHNLNSKNLNRKVYKYIRDNGEFQNWDMVMIEEFPCENKLQKGKRERYWIELLKPSLNVNTPTRTIKEWREHNGDKIKEQCKKYYENNIDKIKEQMKEYRENNSEKIKEQCKEWRENNVEKMKEKMKEWRENNVDKIKEQRKIKYICECGSTISKICKSRHERSKKHLNFISNK